MSAIPLNFAAGDTLGVRDHAGLLNLLRVVERKRAGYLLKPLNDSDPVTWSDERIADAYFQRRLEIHRCDVERLSKAAAEVIAKTWEYWPAEVRREAERRQEYVREVAAIRGDHRTLIDAYGAAADAVHARKSEEWRTEDLIAAGERRVERRARRRRAPSDEKDLDEAAADLKHPGKPNAYTVRDWYLRWDGHGRDVRLLIPHVHRRGNHKARFRKEPGDSPDSYKLMAAACEAHWLKPLKVTKDYVYKKYKELCEQHRLTPQSDRSFRNFIHGAYDDRHEYMKRNGHRAAYMKFGVFQRRTPPDRPLEEVEIDHCLIDLWIVDPVSGKPIGRPWLTAIIDRATRVILGMHISFEASYASTQRAMAHAMWPKDLRGIEGLDHGWECHGLWDVIFTDNGREFRGNAMRTTASQLDFSAIPLPAKSPWLKGIIERLWGRINVQVFSHEEGSTLSKSPDCYDPMKSASLTMDELRFKLLKWVVDDYHETEHETLKCTPMARWLELTALYPVRPVPSFDHVVRLTGAIVKRKISNVGVRNDGLLYADKDNGYAHLTRLLHRRGGLSKDWLIRIDPFNYGEIWILDDAKGEWLDLPCTDPEISVGVSKYQHRIHRHLAQRSAGPGQEVTASMLGRAEAEAERQAAASIAGGTKQRGAARAARYASSPSYFTPMPLAGRAEGASTPLLGVAGPTIVSVAEAPCAPVPEAAPTVPALEAAADAAPPAAPAFDLQALIDKEASTWG